MSRSAKLLAACGAINRIFSSIEQISRHGIASLQGAAAAAASQGIRSELRRCAML